MAEFHWLLEDMSDGQDTRMLDAAKAAGHQVTSWDDSWWYSGRFPLMIGETCLFHGSLGNAARIKRELRWTPGAYCDTEALSFSAWAPHLTDLLVSHHWRRTTVANLASNPNEVATEIGSPARIFVRPDSPLKPFSGRILDLASVTLAALDHGFYYDNIDLPVIVAPEVQVGSEWRTVVVAGQVVAQSAYEADGRRAKTGTPPREVIDLAELAASRAPVADQAVVIDVAEVNGGWRIVELNPFSGADLYNCDRNSVVRAISSAVN